MNVPLAVGGLVLLLSLSLAAVTCRYLPPPHRGRHARTTGGNP
ncbi:hypothetical protein ABZ883_14630 [Streptomyces sp. NPDC046977]